MLNLEKIDYKNLKARQKETFNFQKVSAILADYGYATIRITDDWESADFIAQHIDGENFLKVQLKSRLTFNNKYFGKNIWICFPNKNEWFLYNHDELLAKLIDDNSSMQNTKSWSIWKSYTYPSLSKKNKTLLASYKL